jgi:hypothetical protein
MRDIIKFLLKKKYEEFVILCNFFDKKYKEKLIYYVYEEVCIANMQLLVNEYMEK